jgi:hypothetical protein
VTEANGTSQAPPTAPGAPHDTFSININEHSGSKSVTNCNTSISTPSTPEHRDTSTNILSGVYTNTIQIQRKNCVRAIRVSEFQWKLFLKKARELGFSANELINQFIG